MKIYNYPFPGVIFANKAQFDDYRQSHSNLLDYRYAFEQSLAGNKAISVTGICPLTLQHTTFTSDITSGEKRSDGKVVPDWRGEQRDDNGVYMPDRATAHYALYNAPEAGLGRTLLVAGTESLLPILKNYSDSLEHLPLNLAIASKKVYDTILIVNRLEIERDPADTLKKLHARLSEDGRLYFHANFHYGDEKSVQRDDGSWALGWDVLSTLSAAGFSTPAAITFWSQELGYFGPSNLVFEASK